MLSKIQNIQICPKIVFKQELLTESLKEEGQDTRKEQQNTEQENHQKINKKSTGGNNIKTSLQRKNKKRQDGKKLK